MPRNGSGTYSLPSGNPVVTGTTISSTVHNNTMSDIATALSQSISSTGVTTPSANLPMGGFKLTGLGAGSSSGDSVRYEQLAEAVTKTGDITMSGAMIIEAEGAAVASASTTNIWATDGNTVHVTGTTTITSFGAAPQAGAWMKVIFDDALILTQSADLNLNGGGSNLTTAAGDMALVYADTTTQMDVFLTRKSGSSTVAVSAATQAEMEAASSNTVTATPGNTNWHPGVAKAWLKCDAAGNISVSHNITSITDTGTGDVAITIGTDFSSANYVVVATLEGNQRMVAATSFAAGSFSLKSFVDGGGASDPTSYFVACFGDQ